MSAKIKHAISWLISSAGIVAAVATLFAVLSPSVALANRCCGCVLDGEYCKACNGCIVTNVYMGCTIVIGC